MTEEEMRPKGAVAIRLALKAGDASVFDELRECVDELDEDSQNELYNASELLGDAILDVQSRSRT
jgi:hypothetical protein